MAMLNWVHYRNKDGRLLWHAWSPGAQRSFCGSVRSGMLWRPGRVEASAEEVPPEGEVCRKCAALTGVSQNMPQEPSASHLDERCACRGCRKARKQGAARWNAQVEREVAEVACSCVVGATKANPILSQVLDEAERRFALRLFLWETLGGQDERTEAGASRVLLLDLWGAAARTWAGTGGGVHLCGAQTSTTRE